MSAQPESLTPEADWATVLSGLRDSMRQRLSGASSRYAAPAALPAPCRRLVDRFGLTPFETGVLLLCAAVEWDAAIAEGCAALQGDSSRAGLTYALAIDFVAEGSWAALSPFCKLRRWRLVDLAPGVPIATSRVSVDERILQYLLETSFLDPRLEGLIQPVTLAAEASALSERLTALWEHAGTIATCPVLELPGRTVREALQLGSAVCAPLGLRLHRIDGRAIPSPFAEREALARLWEREALLLNGALLVDGASLDSSDIDTRVVPFLESLQGVALFTGVLPRLQRTQLRVDLDPEPASPLNDWRKRLGPLATHLNGHLEPVCSQFRLPPEALQRAVERVQDSARDDLAESLWEACRIEARGDLDNLAQRVDVRASWNDLVLPKAQLETLRTLALHVRQRHRVYSEWGFAERCTRGLGINALFSGTSGTGKTLAAEVLASELHLDLYRIDLSTMVSKYIGETEKNLRRVFDGADAGGCILLFDEADALFGSRSEVRDSHDRYANLEVSYLLQRIETYRGLAILTTNLKRAIDTAFLRRLRFVVHFPVPDVGSRREIWERAFPEQAPREGVSVDRLARLALTGGHIRNIALSAAFLAAESGAPIRMQHLLRAVESEYAKLEKPLSRADVGDWL